MRRALGATLVTLAMATPAAARAQSKADASHAEADFTAGKHLLEHGDTPGACDRFAESKRLDPGLGVTLYLADCYQRLGKTASAWTEFRSAEQMARARNDKRADLAHRRAQALEPKLMHLTVRVVPSSMTPEVTLDGVALPADTWGTAMPVDPGDHAVIARAGSKVREYDVHLDADRTAAEIAVEAFEEPPPPPESVSTEPAPPPPETPAEPENDATRTWVSVGLVGAGVVGVGLGSLFGVMAISDRNASNAGPCNAADQCNARGLSLRDDAIREARISTIAFVAGTAGLGAGVVVFFVLPRKQAGPAVGGLGGRESAGAPVSGVSVSAAPIAGGGEALVRATF
jgi:serine/threonine-protein kinase